VICVKIILILVMAEQKAAWQANCDFQLPHGNTEALVHPAADHSLMHKWLLPTMLCAQALELPNPAEPIRGLIKALFDQCERDKPKVQPNEPLDKEYCKNFALTVFSRADKLDRAKRADINTAKCYYAAAIFLQVRSLSHSGPLRPTYPLLSALVPHAQHRCVPLVISLPGPASAAAWCCGAQVLEQFLGHGEELELAEPEAVEKARYALWRAAELRKAIREGRPPAPPPEPADVAAAVAGAVSEYGSSGGGAGGDMFAGPAYEAGGGYDEAQQQQQQQQPPSAAPSAHAGEVR
jgi:hypothetical protein